MTDINKETIKKYLKTSCELFSHCDGVNIKNNVEKWYGLHNIPFTENASNIETNIDKYKGKPIQGKTSVYILDKIIKVVIYVINKLLNTEIDFTGGGLYEKYKLYNVVSYFLHFMPTYYISFVLLFFNNCKSLFNMEDNDTFEKWPNKFMYIFVGFCVLSLFLLLNGLKKIYKCLDGKIEMFYIFSILYTIVLIIINNLIIPLFVNNIFQDNSNTGKGLTVGLCIFSTLIFSIITIIIYISKRLKLDTNIIIKDSLYLKLFGDYITETLNVITTIFLISVICIKILSSGGTFFISLFMGIVYFIYFFIFYIHIYGLLEGGNYNKIGLYTILLIIFLTFFCIFFLYEMVQNLKEICNTKDTVKESNPIKMLITIFVNVILIILSIFLFGMVYNNNNWEQNKYNFYALFIIFTIIVFSSRLYTLQNSTSIYYFIWFVITCVQYKNVWKLIKLIICFIYELFSNL